MAYLPPPRARMDCAALKSPRTGCRCVHCKAKRRGASRTEANRDRLRRFQAALTQQQHAPVKTWRCDCGRLNADTTSCASCGGKPGWAA